MSWLKLIRWKNLLIIFLTQLLVWWCVIVPDSKNFEPNASLVSNAQTFLLLTLSTILIAAAGYIINDYFDIKIDVINKPEKVVLERAITLKTAILFHSILNIIALLLAAIVAGRAHHYEWLLLQFSCTVLLWFYSTHFKRQFVIGNFVVALLASLTVIVLVIYKPAIHYYFDYPVYLETSLDYFELNPLWLLGVYTFFAFILTWMREVVKDMEDYKGDAEEGCITMPIKWGLERTAKFTQLLGIISLVVLVISEIALIGTDNIYLQVYIVIALIIPLSLWIKDLNTKATKEHYHKASSRIKWIMVLGVCSLIVHYITEWLR